MNENEVIIVNGIPNSSYDDLIKECVRYAIISLPFTVDRMSIPDEKYRALNIAKGKVAESLFQFFCEANDINPDFNSCSTEFWTVDKRDFILRDKEWDIKNNFIYASHELLEGNYTDLPALVPNRRDGDQWSKRNQNVVAGTEGVEFLFSFLKNATLTNGSRGNPFLEIVLTREQQDFLRELYTKYRGLPQLKEPFSEEWFWNEMNSRGGLNFYRLNSRPFLVITSYANSAHWNEFKNTGRFDRQNNFQTYVAPRWYVKTQKGSCNFLAGTMWTTITNSTIPISRLPSFLSLFPQLNNRIVFGEIKSLG